MGYNSGGYVQLRPTSMHPGMFFLLIRQMEPHNGLQQEPFHSSMHWQIGLLIKPTRSHQALVNPNAHFPSFKN